MDSESEEDDSYGLSGEEYENNKTMSICSVSRSESENEEEDITHGHAKTMDSGDINATNSSDISNNKNNILAREKKQEEHYCEFTWAELSHSTEPIPLIPKPDVTGG